MSYKNLLLIKPLFIFIADEINHLTSSEFQRRLLADRSTKLELILAGKILNF